MTFVTRRPLSTSMFAGFLLVAGAVVNPSVRAAEPVVEVVARDLQNPWAVAFIGQGRMLVTERPGRMRVIEPDGRVGQPLEGLPAIDAVGQGGLLDIF